MARRDALKAIGAGILAAGSAALLRGGAQAATSLRYTPEKGAQLRRSRACVASEHPRTTRRQHSGAERFQSITPGHLALPRTQPTTA